MEGIACRSPEDLNTIFTIGHPTHTLAEFMSLLEEVQVDLVVDVRSTKPTFVSKSTSKRATSTPHTG